MLVVQPSLPLAERKRQVAGAWHVLRVLEQQLCWVCQLHAKEQLNTPQVLLERCERIELLPQVGLAESQPVAAPKAEAGS